MSHCHQNKIVGNDKFDNYLFVHFVIHECAKTLDDQCDDNNLLTHLKILNY